MKIKIVAVFALAFFIQACGEESQPKFNVNEVVCVNNLGLKYIVTRRNTYGGNIWYVGTTQSGNEVAFKDDVLSKCKI